MLIVIVIGHCDRTHFVLPCSVNKLPLAGHRAPNANDIVFASLSAQTNHTAGINTDWVTPADDVDNEMSKRHGFMASCRVLNSGPKYAQIFKTHTHWLK